MTSKTIGNNRKVENPTVASNIKEVDLKEKWRKNAVTQHKLCYKIYKGQASLPWIKKISLIGFSTGGLSAGIIAIAMRILGVGFATIFSGGAPIFACVLIVVCVLLGIAVLGSLTYWLVIAATKHYDKKKKKLETENQKLPDEAWNAGIPAAEKVLEREKKELDTKIRESLLPRYEGLQMDISMSFFISKQDLTPEHKMAISALKEKIVMQMNECDKLLQAKIEDFMPSFNNYTKTGKTLSEQISDIFKKIKKDIEESYKSAEQSYRTIYEQVSDYSWKKMDEQRKKADEEWKEWFDSREKWYDSRKKQEK